MTKKTEKPQAKTRTKNGFNSNNKRSCFAGARTPAKHN